jgi:DNA-binding PadR family transcriptional regulator
MWDNWRNTLNNWKNMHERVDKLHKLGGLRIWILHALDHGPKNGVEIMDAIQEHHEEMYQARLHHDSADKHYNHHLKRTMRHAASRPSPGSVYPMLKKMVAEDLITKLEDGKYDLTDTGRETVHEIFGHIYRPNRSDRGSLAIESALMEIENYVSYLEDIKKEKLIPHEEMIKSLSERIKLINESLHDEN